MGFGPIRVFSVGYSLAASFSSAFTLPNDVSRAFLEVPSLSTNSELYLLASTDGSTFRRVMHPPPNTSNVQANTFTIATTSNNKFVEIPLAAPFIKVEPTSAASASATFKIICT